MTIHQPSAPASRLVERVARWNVMLGVVLLLVKLAAWWQTRSVALLADALESIVNVVAAGVAAFALAISGQPPDKRHPFGHSKAEYLSAVLEGGLVITAAAVTLREAWVHLRAPQPPAALGLGLSLATIAAAANGAAAWYLRRLGKRHRSPALVASAAHLWGDVLTTAGVLAGLLAAWVSGYWVIDPVIAMLVALNILRLGWHVVRDSLGGLMDEALPAADLERIESIVRCEMAGALQAHQVRTRRAGPRRFVEFHLVVPGAMRVDDAHAICDRLEDAIEDALPGTEVVIHVEPDTHLQDAAPGGRVDRGA